MFDFAWSEIAVIGVVALVLIGPKDMPAALRAVSGVIKKARRMAAEFQTHVDEMVREADLQEIRNQINEIRNFDFRREIERQVDPDGSIRKTFETNPLDQPVVTPPPAAAPAMEEVTVIEAPAAEPQAAETEAAARTALSDVPAFVPPGLVKHAANSAADELDAPAFIPPAAVLQRRSRSSA